MFAELLLQIPAGLAAIIPLALICYYATRTTTKEHVMDHDELERELDLMLNDPHQGETSKHDEL